MRKQILIGGAGLILGLLIGLGLGWHELNKMAARDLKALVDLKDRADAVSEVLGDQVDDLKKKWGACEGARIAQMPDGTQTVLADLTPRGTAGGGHEYVISFGPLRLALPIGGATTPYPPALFVLPGRVVPTLASDAPGAVYGYVDAQGTFGGWRVPKKAQ